MSDKIVVVKGDCHGDPSDVINIVGRMAKRGVNPSDVVFVVAGDFGIPWPGYPEENKEKLHQLNSIGCQIVAILGNHEWWSLIYGMPHGIFCGASVYQCRYDNVLYKNIHFVADPTVMTVDGKSYLLIPGADSHDIRDGILFGIRPVGETENYKTWYAETRGQINGFTHDFQKTNGYWPQYRIEGSTWWREEATQFDVLYDILDRDRSFHAVVSHDAPDDFAYEFQRHRSIYERYPSTDAEVELGNVYRSIDFKYWVHGHFHYDMTSRDDPRVTISYFVPHILSDNFPLTVAEKCDMISI